LSIVVINKLSILVLVMSILTKGLRGL